MELLLLYFQLTWNGNRAGQVDNSNVVTNQGGQPVVVWNDNAGLLSGSTEEQLDWAEHDSEPPGLMLTVKPAMSGSQQPLVAHEYGTADRLVHKTDEIDKKSSLKPIDLDLIRCIP